MQTTGPCTSRRVPVPTILVVTDAAAIHHFYCALAACESRLRSTLHTGVAVFLGLRLRQESFVQEHFSICYCDVENEELVCKVVVHVIGIKNLHRKAMVHQRAVDGLSDVGIWTLHLCQVFWREGELDVLNCRNRRRSIYLRPVIHRGDTNIDILGRDLRVSLRAARVTIVSCDDRVGVQVVVLDLEGCRIALRDGNTISTVVVEICQVQHTVQQSIHVCQGSKPTQFLRARCPQSFQDR
mmetsp:Transcript_2419/g.5749  ORF Transcript_2419/g.5749 Transcript_2419/m.5749 type:complete len:240 (+) Transcript_2419:2465-3184(+)